MESNNYIVEVAISKKELMVLNRSLGFTTTKSIKPKTSIETLIRAIGRNQILILNNEE